MPTTSTPPNFEDHYLLPSDAPPGHPHIISVTQNPLHHPTSSFHLCDAIATLLYHLDVSGRHPGILADFFDRTGIPDFQLVEVSPYIDFRLVIWRKHFGVVCGFYYTPLPNNPNLPIPYSFSLLMDPSDELLWTPILYSSIAFASHITGKWTPEYGYLQRTTQEPMSRVWTDFVHGRHYVEVMRNGLSRRLSETRLADMKKEMGDVERELTMLVWGKVSDVVEGERKKWGGGVLGSGLGMGVNEDLGLFDKGERLEFDVVVERMGQGLTAAAVAAAAAAAAAGPT